MKAYIEPEEVTLMEQATTNLRDRLLIRLLFYLACLVSEALALKVEDIDFNRGTVTIQHLKSRLKLSCTECGQRLGRSHTFCPKCGGKVEKAQTEQREHRRQRVLPVDSEILSMLKEYVQRGGPVSREGKRLIHQTPRDGTNRPLHMSREINSRSLVQIIPRLQGMSSTVPSKNGSHHLFSVLKNTNYTSTLYSEIRKGGKPLCRPSQKPSRRNS